MSFLLFILGVCVCVFVCYVCVCIFIPDGIGKNGHAHREKHGNIFGPMPDLCFHVFDFDCLMSHHYFRCA